MAETIHDEAVLAKCTLKFLNNDPNKNNRCFLTATKLYVFQNNQPPKTFSVNKVSYADAVSKHNFLYLLLIVFILIIFSANHYLHIFPKPVSENDFYELVTVGQQQNYQGADLNQHFVLNTFRYQKALKEYKDNQTVITIVFCVALLWSISSFFKRKIFGLRLVIDGQQYFFSSQFLSPEINNFLGNLQKRMGK